LGAEQLAALGLEQDLHAKVLCARVVATKVKDHSCGHNSIKQIMSEIRRVPDMIRGIDINLLVGLLGCYESFFTGTGGSRCDIERLEYNNKYMVTRESK